MLGYQEKEVYDEMFLSRGFSALQSMQLAESNDYQEVDDTHRGTRVEYHSIEISFIKVKKIVAFSLRGLHLI